MASNWMTDKRQTVAGDRKVAHLHKQAERARKIAAECGPSLLVELFELHAQLCEQKAAARQSRKRKAMA